MDLNDKDKFGMEKSSTSSGPLNFHTSNNNISSDWRFNGINLTNSSVGMVPTDNSITNPPMGSSVSMVDSFCPGLWDHHSSQNLGFCENSMQNNAAASDGMAIAKLGAGPSRSGIEKSLDIGWNLPNSMSKAGLYLHGGTGILPQTLAQFPADSAFIERAARFSCFSGGGGFSDLGNPFNISESLGPFSKGGGIQVPESEPQMADVGKGVNLSIDNSVTEGSPMKSGERATDEGKCGVGGSSNESDETEISRGAQGEPSAAENVAGEPSLMGVGAKKRKRNGQDVEPDQAKGGPHSSVETTKDNDGTKQKGDQNPTSATTKPTGKNGKESAQNSDAPKEDYIHVRARRGQATNSHSLAERVRREKISERMKFLQDLVPGCSKVTGKAVMLDEIINYVQSLQRQVEFLSMKLATVNPHLDINFNSLSKDILQSRGSTSSALGFTPDMSMVHPQLHPSQHNLIESGIPGLGSPSDMFRRSITSQIAAMNGFKGPTPQMPTVWDGELNGLVQMNFGTNAQFSAPELNGKTL